VRPGVWGVFLRVLFSRGLGPRLRCGACRLLGAIPFRQRGGKPPICCISISFQFRRVLLSRDVWFAISCRAPGGAKLPDFFLGNRTFTDKCPSLANTHDQPDYRSLAHICVCDQDLSAGTSRKVPCAGNSRHRPARATDYLVASLCSPFLISSTARIPSSLALACRALCNAKA